MTKDKFWQEKLNRERAFREHCKKSLENKTFSKFGEWVKASFYTNDSTLVEIRQLEFRCGFSSCNEGLFSYDFAKLPIFSWGVCEQRFHFRRKSREICQTKYRQ